MNVNHGLKDRCSAEYKVVHVVCNSLYHAIAKVPAIYPMITMLLASSTTPCDRPINITLAKIYSAEPFFTNITRIGKMKLTTLASTSKRRSGFSNKTVIVTRLKTRVYISILQFGLSNNSACIVY